VIRELTTTVVNLRVTAYDVYIGRAGYGQEGFFGNPYRVGELCARCGKTHTTPGDTIPCFRSYFMERLTSDSEYRDRVEGLRGKRLGCFCIPGPCHGRIIANYLNGASK
jgi:hypothetical protein